MISLDRLHAGGERMGFKWIQTQALELLEIGEFG